MKIDKSFEEKIEKEYFFLRVLNGCWIMLFLLLKIRIETTRLDLILNLKREWIKRHKRWKYLKISGRILK